MWVKICANTCVEDAVKAAELGADAVGFVFAPSARQVTAAAVRVMVRKLPPGVERIGVFGRLTVEEIAAAAETARLTGVQLHGGSNGMTTDGEMMARLGELMPELAVMPVVHWEIADGGGAARDAAAALDRIAGYALEGRVLVDAKVGAASGGLGVPFDWDSAQGVFDAQRERGLSVVLAGGLRSENVAEAVRKLRPWGVDVASGVEREPGRKDFSKLRLFIENARGA